MAKRRTKAQETAQHERAPAVSTAGAVESTIEEFAEDLVSSGNGSGEGEIWLAQRKAIADRLSQIRDTAQKLLSELAGGAAKMAVAVRRRAAVVVVLAQSTSRLSRPWLTARDSDGRRRPRREPPCPQPRKRAGHGNGMRRTPEITQQEVRGCEHPSPALA